MERGDCHENTEWKTRRKGREPKRKWDEFSKPQFLAITKTKSEIKGFDEILEGLFLY